jgi:hypothetical protein
MEEQLCQLRRSNRLHTLVEAREEEAAVLEAAAEPNTGLERETSPAGADPAIFQSCNRTEVIAPDRALLNLAEAHDAIIEEARVFSTIQANKHRREELVIEAGTLVYLSTFGSFCREFRLSKSYPGTSGRPRLSTQATSERFALLFFVFSTATAHFSATVCALEKYIKSKA